MIPLTVFPAVTTQYNVDGIVRYSLCDGKGYIAVRQKYVIIAVNILAITCRSSQDLNLGLQNVSHNIPLLLQKIDTATPDHFVVP